MVTQTIVTSITTTSPGNNESFSPTKLVGKKTRSLRWAEKGTVHCQLVRDVKWRRYGSAPNINAAAVHRDPEREYFKHNQQTIRTKLKQAGLLVRLYHCDTCPEEDRAFLESCELDREPDEAEKNGSRLFLPNSNSSSFDVTALTVKIADMTKLLAEAEAKTNQIANDNRNLKSENKQLASARDKLQTEYQRAVDEKHTIHAFIGQIGNERDKLKSENTHLRSSLDQLQAYTEGLLANNAEEKKNLEALLECNAKLLEKQNKIEIMEERSAKEKLAQKREERLLSSALYELGLDIMKNNLYGGPH